MAPPRLTDKEVRAMLLNAAGLSNAHLLHILRVIDARLGQQDTFFRSSVFYNFDNDDAIQGLQILCAISQELKFGMIKCDFSGLMEDRDLPPHTRDMEAPGKTGRPAKKLVKKLVADKAKRQRPIIYAMLLAKPNTLEPLEKDDLRQVLFAADDYVDGFGVADAIKGERAYHIDRKITTHTTSAPPKQKVLNGERRYIADGAVRDQWKVLSRAMKDRIAEQDDPNNSNKPGLLLRSVGYTADPETRSTDHLTHHSSHPLLNLLHAIIKDKFPKGKYGVHFVLLYECINEQQPRLAEHIISLLFTSYSPLGGCDILQGGKTGLANVKQIPQWVWTRLRDANIDRMKEAIDREKQLIDTVKMEKRQRAAEAEVRNKEFELENAQSNLQAAESRAALAEFAENNIATNMRNKL